jgi:hypothetical protein
MGQSKVPIFAYVDESGNTGKNIFDEAQPDFFTAAVVSKGDFDALWGARLGEVAAAAGVDALHGKELGLAKLESIAPQLFTALEKSNAHFFLSRVEKRYLLATKMFDVLFDSGENAAVDWHVYNLRPLKIMMAFKLAAIVDDATARDFWKCLLLPSEAEARKMLPAICEGLKAKLPELPDARSKEVLGNGLNWIIKHPEAIHFGPEQKLAKQGHFPNLVAFANLLQGLQQHSERWKRKVGYIIHDQQSEFENTLKTWHELFSNASPEVVKWAGEEYSLQWVPESKFVMKSDKESVGIQIADVVLWLFGQALKKDLPEGCARILSLVLERGWHNDFSFTGVERSLLQRWGDVFFGPMDPEKLEAARKMIEASEKRRVESMAQFETDGIPPFERTGGMLPKQK